MRNTHKKLLNSCKRIITFKGQGNAFEIPISKSENDTVYKLQKAFTVKRLAATHESEAFSISYDGIGILKIYGL